GRVGSESDPKIDFQLSQRADFFTELCSVDTLHRRPLINSRDEPHADAKRYRRLHVICGDANLSEYATALKIGTTALVLATLEAGYGPPGRLKQPVETLQKLSRDANRRWLVELEGEGTISALELQRLYLRAAQELFLGRDEETNWVLREWESVLNDLERDYTRCADRVDWAAKYQLLQQFVESERLTWQDEVLRSLDLEYHNVDPQRGLFYELQRQGCLRRIVSDSEIERARESPPKETRAWVRGLCVQKFSDSILALNWGQIHLRDGEGELTIDLKRWVDGRLGALDPESFEAASTPRALWRMIKQL
ncbi:MAG: proteasome accessory factor PafA2 family protein, partial [Candidatus Bipolaricaulota bacterium]|nr:proteasome accessory factor PafA2 family protein [Candidatus Bipolaricaulota bacterium]